MAGFITLLYYWKIQYLPLFKVVQSLYEFSKLFSSKNHTSRTITFYTNNEDTVLRYTNLERLKIAYFMSFYVLQAMNISFYLRFLSSVVIRKTIN